LQGITEEDGGDDLLLTLYFSSISNKTLYIFDITNKILKKDGVENLLTEFGENLRQSLKMI